MARYPLFGIGQTGKSPQVTAQRRINVYLEPRPDGERGRFSIHQRPGLVYWTDFGTTPVRGMHEIGDLLYVVHRDKLYEVNNAKQVTELGILDTFSGQVSMSDNGTQLIVVDGQSGYIYNIDTASFQKITDTDFVTADTVVFQGGRFIVNRNGTGQFYISDSYDGTSWDALNFATAETFPDDLVAVWEDQGELVLFGEKSMEVWANVGALDFPYQRVDGAVIEWGLAARWSLSKVGNTTCWLGKNRNGETQVMRLEGYRPVPISTPEVEYAIQGYASVISASALSYHSAGHTFYQLNFPGPGVSWVYDATSGQWSEFQTGATGARHRAALGVQYINRTIVSDYTTGNLYEMDAEALDDAGVAFVKEIQSRHLFDEEHISVGRLWADMETGVGLATGQGSNPQVMLQVSKDGGQTWGPERWTGLGAIGEFAARPIWRTLGRAYDWTFRLRVSDPVQFSLAGAWVDAE